MAVEKSTEKGLARAEPPMFSSPFSLMRRLSDDMERAFEDTWGAGSEADAQLELAETCWTPTSRFERRAVRRPR
jgi:hypothetical protein